MLMKATNWNGKFIFSPENFPIKVKNNLDYDDDNDNT